MHDICCCDIEAITMSCYIPGYFFKDCLLNECQKSTSMIIYLSSTLTVFSHILGWYSKNSMSIIIFDWISFPWWNHDSPTPVILQFAYQKGFFCMINLNVTWWIWIILTDKFTDQLKIKKKYKRFNHFQTGYSIFYLLLWFARDSSKVNFFFISDNKRTFNIILISRYDVHSWEI